MQCKANKCPIGAEFVTTWQTVNKKMIPKWGVCRFHRMANPDNWTETTRRVILFQKQIEFLIELRKEKDPLFRYHINEPVSGWVDRYEDNLKRMIIGTIDQHDADANFAHVIQLLGG